MKGPEASWKGICSTYMRDQSRGPEKEDLEEAKTERTKNRPGPEKAKPRKGPRPEKVGKRPRSPQKAHKRLRGQKKLKKCSK